jgi:hypothetical protein
MTSIKIRAHRDVDPAFNSLWPLQKKRAHRDVHPAFNSLWPLQK